MKRLFGVIYLAAGGMFIFRLLLLLGTSSPLPTPSVTITDTKAPPGKFHPWKEPVPSAPPPCGDCHNSLPHKSNSRGAFLNSHLISLECFVCHLKPVQGLPKGKRRDDRLSLEDLPIFSLPHRLSPEWRFLPRRSERCSSCHSAQTSFPYQSLGYTTARREKLRNLPQTIIIDQASPWVIPDF